MKAAVIEEIGVAPRVTTLEDPPCAGENQVVIKVEAAALNAIDLLIDPCQLPARRRSRCRRISHTADRRLPA
jgi:NADPH:quinone reductase-like Zn-dependent oxidoreductase